MNPLKPRRISREEALLLKEVFGRRLAKAITCKPQSFTLRFSPNTETPFPNVSYTLKVSNMEIGVAVDATAVELLSRRIWGEINWRDLPEEITLTIAESLLEGALEGIYQAFGEPLTLEEVDFNRSPPEGVITLGIELSCGEKAGARGVVWGKELRPVLTRGFLPRMEREEPEATPDIPVVLHPVVGRTHLEAAELSSLKRGDILLLEEFYPREEGTVILVVSEKARFKALIEGSALKIEKPLGVEEVEEKDRETLISTDEIPVELSFELGRLSISLSQLRELQPGYVFELAKGLDQPVDIVANGKLIGRGELVEVDGRIGVRITELAG